MKQEETLSDSKQKTKKRIAEVAQYQHELDLHMKSQLADTQKSKSKSKRTGEQLNNIMLEVVHSVARRPKDYHCTCKYCKQFIGELIRPNGTHYSRKDRRAYYSPLELALVSAPDVGHFAKSPLHIARWAVQQYTKKGEWVLDPTVGAGTTMVEALTHGRNAVGVDIEFSPITKANAESAATRTGGKYAVIQGDARNIAEHLTKLKVPAPFSLIVNNPPYWGDQSQKPHKGTIYKHPEKGTVYTYNKDLDNIAFLKEGKLYFETIMQIYTDCVKSLRKGGHFVIGIKDQMRQYKPDFLHEKLGDVIANIPSMTFVGTAVLRHFPTTLFLNTYEKRYDIRPPLFQSILVFRKEK